MVEAGLLGCCGLFARALGGGLGLVPLSAKGSIVTAVFMIEPWLIGCGLVGKAGKTGLGSPHEVYRFPFIELQKSHHHPTVIPR